MGIAGLLALVLACPAGAAVESAGGFKYVKANPGKKHHFVAECPGNTRVLSGGMFTTAGYGTLSYQGGGHG